MPISKQYVRHSSALPVSLALVSLLSYRQQCVLSPTWTDVQ